MLSGSAANTQLEIVFIAFFFKCQVCGKHPAAELSKYCISIKYDEYDILQTNFRWMLIRLQPIKVINLLDI